MKGCSKTCGQYHQYGGVNGCVVNSFDLNSFTKDTFIIPWKVIPTCWFLLFRFSVFVKETTACFWELHTLGDKAPPLPVLLYWVKESLVYGCLHWPSCHYNLAKNQGYSSSSVTLAYWARRASFLFFDSSDTSFCFTTIWACFSIMLAMAWTSATDKKNKTKKNSQIANQPQ